MTSWDSTNVSIGDIFDWTNLNRLELRPDFQRREVWSQAARVMLIDSILKNIPIPKFYARRMVRDNATFREVIDGQQRLRAILDFKHGVFALTSPPCEERFRGRRFEDLEQRDRDLFVNYRLDMNEITSATDDEVRQIYWRINKYMKQLNKQELRRADFPGDFLKISEDLALSDTLDEFKVFTPANRRRMADVEFVSELLALMIRESPLDKKEQLDAVYEEYMNWAKPDSEEVIQRFNQVINDCQIIFDGDGLHGKLAAIGHTRFRQKSDFYSLFGAIYNLHRQGGSITGKDLKPLRTDLSILDYHIAPSSDVVTLREYAIRCVSDANSASSRRWRIDLLENIICGTYLQKLSKSSEKIFSSILYDIIWGGQLCPPSNETCPFSGVEFSPTPENSILAWTGKSNVLQMSNAQYIQREILEAIKLKDEEAKLDGWLIVDPLHQSSDNPNQISMELDYD
ncbi:DUF262 domain-containing protein [Phormidium tenue]|uniref:DUF262 domain-containing protein n=1 Tax=Phormidium tenue FACHB-1050 TaxID=2692857 RepID=A0ABR8C6E1_9CYAN|nr:DUF262 domain-containing protein [Phormidium tenue]MBD2316354.1 DUF262 domain-containing protein [Phormidium tenue FACHB-1050]